MASEFDSIKLSDKLVHATGISCKRGIHATKLLHEQTNVMSAARRGREVSLRVKEGGREENQHALVRKYQYEGMNFSQRTWSIDAHSRKILEP